MKKGLLAIIMILLSTQAFSQNQIIEKNNVIAFIKDGPPLIHVKILFKIGNQIDINGGEIYLLLKILSQSKLSSILENAGATLECSADYDFFYLEYEVLASSHKKVFEEIMKFLSQYQPSEKEFSLSKSQLLQELKMQEDDYYDKVRFEFYKKLYKNHRYARPITGDFASVDKITLRDIHQTYEKLLNKNWTDIILVGKINKKDLDFYQKNLALIPSKKINLVQDPAMEEYKTDETFTIQAPVTQVFVRLGCLGTKRNDPQSIYYQLISDMVGGGFGSIVMKKLREEKGLTYSPAANFYALRKDFGYFFIAYSTRNENLEKSLHLTQEILENLSKNGISPENFNISRRYLYGSLLQREETNNGISQLITEARVFGLKNDHWLEAKEKILKLDYETANKLVKSFFNQKKYLTIILKPQEK